MVLIHLQVQNFCVIRTVSDDGDDDQGGCRLLPRVNRMINGVLSFRPGGEL
mgnify:FL=1